MYEMLANQYFMTRRYDLACEAYENVLAKRPEDQNIRRKLIVCYTQVGDIKRALDIFISCLEENIECIAEIDTVSEDCPCPELVTELEKKLANNLNSLDFHLMLGMLWLYCDMDKSINYFKKADEIAKDNPTVKYINLLLNAYKNNKQSNKINQQDLVHSNL